MEVRFHSPQDRVEIEQEGMGSYDWKMSFPELGPFCSFWAQLRKTSFSLQKALFGELHAWESIGVGV